MKSEPPLPKQATKARPGTKQKIEVLRDRYAAGQSLYHPQDNAKPIPPTVKGLPDFVPGIRQCFVR